MQEANQIDRWRNLGGEISKKMPTFLNLIWINFTFKVQLSILSYNQHNESRSTDKE